MGKLYNFLRSGFRTKVSSRNRNQTVWFLAAIFALSLLLRILYLKELGSTPQPHDLDARLYGAIARNILAGEWLGGEEVKYTSTPLFGYFLALIYTLFGASKYAALCVQFFLGVCTPVLVYLAGRWLFGHKTGMTASVIVAVYSPVIFYEGIVGKAGLLVFTTSLAIVVLLWAQRRGRATLWLLAGMAVALLPLLRPNTLLFFPLAAVWIVMVSRPLGTRQAARNLGVFLIGTAIIFAPMLLRHVYAVRAGLASSLGGIHFYIGNNPNATGTYAAVPGVLPRAEGHVEDAAVVAEREVGRPLSPSEVSHYWFNKGLQFIWEEPLNFLYLSGSKLGLALSDAEPHVVGHSYYHAQNSSTALKIPLLTFGILLPLGFLGLFLSLRKSRQALILHLFFFSYLVTLCLFFVTGRYRLPLVPPVVLYAAFGAAWLHETWCRDRRRSIATVAAILNLFFILRLQGIARAHFENTCDVNAPGCLCDYLGCVGIFEQLPGTAQERQVGGVAADGVTQVTIKIHTHFFESEGDPTVTVFNDQFNPSISIDEDGAIGRVGEEPTASSLVVPGGADTSSIYRAPVDFARPSGADNGADQRNAFISVTYPGPSGIPVPDLKIVRPPVVLVHGIWSNSTTWNEFGGLSRRNPDPSFQVFRVDYPSADAFAPNADIARAQIGTFVNRFRDEENPLGIPIAATQADIVAHSMGGNVTRGMVLRPEFRRDDNYFRGDVHKLITIDTPHTGSHLANRLSSSNLFCRLVFSIAGYPARGAVRDIAVGSSALQTLAGTTREGLKTHVVVGVASGAQEESAEDNFRNLAFGLATIICPSILPAGGLQEIFGGPSDLIVSEASQAAVGLGWLGETPVGTLSPGGIIHSIIPGLFTLGPDSLSRDILNGEVVGVQTVNPQIVIDALNQSKQGPFFAPIHP